MLKLKKIFAKRNTNGNESLDKNNANNNAFDYHWTSKRTLAIVLGGIHSAFVSYLCKELYLSLANESTLVIGSSEQTASAAIRTELSKLDRTIHILTVVLSTPEDVETLCSYTTLGEHLEAYDNVLLVHVTQNAYFELPTSSRRSITAACIDEYTRNALSLPFAAISRLLHSTPHMYRRCVVFADDSHSSALCGAVRAARHAYLRCISDEYRDNSVRALAYNMPTNTLCQQHTSDASQMTNLSSVKPKALAAGLMKLLIDDRFASGASVTVAHAASNSNDQFVIAYAHCDRPDGEIVTTTPALISTQ